MFLCILTLSILCVGNAIFPDLSNVLPDLPDLGNVSPELPNPLNLLFQNKCMEHIGCFYTGPPFYHAINRPIVLTPTDKLQTKFLLFTPNNPDTEEELELSESSIMNSSFDGKLPVKVLIHGYRTDVETDDVRHQTKDALLNIDDYNIIIVDWTENNGPPYPQALANARAVGAQLARLLKLIMKSTGVKAQDIHLIGHSLGAHISGWAGERIEGLGRISGLDPAGPYFQDADNAVRLDATDALFVDVIHTDGGENFVKGLGISDPIGHMDFYPNGGRRQPGCTYTSESNGTVGAVVNITTQYILTACDHSRANKLYLETVDNSKCRFLATWCNSYDDFEKGDCLPQNSTLSEMGFHAKRIQGVPMKSKFFLRTNSSSPFCIEDSVFL